MDIEKGDVASHYGSPELVERILASLSEAGKSLDSLTVNDFASFDNLHLGGVDETLSLARLATARHGMRVLDVGSGVQPYSCCKSLAVVDIHTRSGTIRRQVAHSVLAGLHATLH